MRLAIDAITQAEGAPPAAVAPPPAPPAAIAPPATPPPTPQTQTQPPQPTQQSQIVTPQTAPTTTPMPTSDGQTHDGQNVSAADAPPAEKNRNTAKAEAKLEKALEYLATLNTTATAKPDKWVVNASILASLTGCYRPAINTFIEARKQRIDELNAAHGLGPGHNRATARTHPNATSLSSGELAFGVDERPGFDELARETPRRSAVCSRSLVSVRANSSRAETPLLVPNSGRRQTDSTRGV
jgi:hypothetical protein